MRFPVGASLLAKAAMRSNGRTHPSARPPLIGKHAHRLHRFTGAITNLQNHAAGLIGQFDALRRPATGAFHALDRLAGFALDQTNHVGNLRCRAAGARRQLPHFIRHHRKPAALIPGARCLNGGIECQQIGLVGNRADGVDDRRDLLRAFAKLCDQGRGLRDVVCDFAHFAGGLLDHLGALLGDFPGCHGNVISRAGAACILLVLLDTGADVRGEFHHFAQAPGGVVHRVVVGLQPHGLPALVDALELALKQLTLIQPPPEILVGTAVDQLRPAEQAVMFTLELSERVTHARQKILVGRENTAVEIEFDHCHCPVDRLQLGAGLAFLLDLGRHVHGVLDHFHHTPRRILDRVVTGLQPDWLALAVDPFEGAGLELAVFQARPQLGVLLAATKIRGAETPMGLANHLFSAVARGFEEIVVGTQHHTVEVELDHGHGAVDGLEQAILLGDGVLKVVEGGLVAIEKHVSSTWK
ncbi:hypothetical protein EMIT0215P_170110 [Pseudomonas serboccidentalis]